MLGGLNPGRAGPGSASAVGAGRRRIGQMERAGEAPDWRRTKGFKDSETGDAANHAGQAIPVDGDSEFS